jgi:hypothetical protein
MNFFERNKNKFIFLVLLSIPFMSIFYMLTETLVLDDYLWHIKIGIFLSLFLLYSYCNIFIYLY